MLGRALPGIGLLLIGLAIAGFGGLQLIQYQGTVADTVEREGTVTLTDVREFTERRDADSDQVQEEVTEYRPIVRYRYSYDGQTYESSGLYPGSERAFPTRDAAATLAENYQEGETVTVYVDPDRPARSFLIKSSPPTANYVLLLIGAATVLAGTHAVYTAARNADWIELSETDT